MQQQQQNSMVDNWRRNFNIAFWVLLVLQRAIIVPFRMYWGLNALGLPCLWAFGLIVLWATFSCDPFMFVWLAIWVISLAKRRRESKKAIEAGAPIHSDFDGMSALSKKDEKVVRFVLEPFIVGWLGGFLYWVYDRYGMPVGGLPSFFLAGAVALPLVEMIRRQIWDQRVQSMVDARIQQEALMKDVRERIGDN